MKPQRYRCALLPALLLSGAGLVALPPQASAQDDLSSELRSALREVTDLIDQGDRKSVV